MARLLPVVAVVLVALVGCGEQPSASPSPVAPSSVSPSPLTVSGRVTVEGYRTVMRNGSVVCVTDGGYTDIREGAQVVVSDASSKTIGLGQLGRGSWDGAGRCIFLFKVGGVPPGQEFYGIEVSHRGRVQYTAAQLIVPVTLTIGD